jgi:regulator of protease activity HflC (stomatin/prohibitin superfamily)
MKKVVFFLAASVLLFMTSCTRISPTEVGFKISNSGNYRGIDSLPLLTGYQWYMPFTSKIVTIPTTQQHIVWSEDDKEGNEPNQEITVSCFGGAGFKMDVGMNYRVNPYRASKIYLKYNTGDLESISQTYLRNAVRKAMQDASGEISVDSILNNLPGYEAAVFSNLKTTLEPEGFIVDLFSILHQPTPTDKDLQASINQKIKAKQDAERTRMELQSSVAEAAKSVATAKGDSAAKVINAAGEAEAVKKIQSVLTPTYVDYVKWKNAGNEVPRVPSVVTGGGTLLNLKNQ